MKLSEAYLEKATLFNTQLLTREEAVDYGKIIQIETMLETVKFLDGKNYPAIEKLQNRLESIAEKEGIYKPLLFILCEDHE